MFADFGRRIKLNARAIAAAAGYALFGGVLGYGLGILIVFLERDEADITWMPLGAMMACMVLVIVQMIAGMRDIPTNFNIDISMGVTRKSFYAGTLLIETIKALAAVLAAALVAAPESMIYRTLFPEVKCEVFYKPMDFIMVMAPFLILVFPVLALFIGVMTLRYGRRVFWIWWVVYMVLCIGGPRFADYVTENPGTPVARMLAKIGAALMTGLPFLIAAAVLVLAAILLIGWRAIRKQGVTA